MTTRTIRASRAAGIAAALLLATGSLLADSVQTKSGSSITGKITKIDAASVVVSTDFAGDIKVKKTEIVSLSTDTPLHVRVAGGAVAFGTIVSKTPGAATLVVNDAKGPVTVDSGKIAAVWAAGAKDPDLAKLERHWSYQAGLDVTGRTGNSNQIGTDVSFRATLASSYDTLQLYAAYNRQAIDGVTSTDQGNVGVDYQDNFYGRLSWYARDELGFDHINFIDLYNTAAAGLGYDLIKTKVDTLTVRLGLAHRYDEYSNPAAENLDALALDTGLINTLTMKKWTMSTLVTFTPSFDDFSTFHFYHESTIGLPLADPHWKFQMGVSNDYYSPLPMGATQRMDTTYFGRLLLNWK